MFSSFLVSFRLHSSQRTTSLPASLLLPPLGGGLTSRADGAAAGLHQARDLVLAGAVLIVVKVSVPVVLLEAVDLSILLLKTLVVIYAQAFMYIGSLSLFIDKSLYNIVQK